MAVNHGYKKTEVGVIPEEWDVKHLGDLGTVVRGGSPRPAGHPRYFNGDFIPWLTVGSLTNIPENQMFVTDTLGKLTEEGSKHSRILQKGTLVIVNSGAKTLGVAKVLAITCCANDGIAALVSQRDGNKQFLCYYLNSQIKRLREVVAAGNDQLNLNTGRIAIVPVPFPSEPEQRVIAEALSDVDALMGSLDRLIAKKRDIKQAVMQQLLTGQTRLHGFHGEWEVRPLGALGSTYGGLTGKTKADFGEGSGRYVTFKNIIKNVIIDCTIFERVRISPTETQNPVLKGDLLFNGSSETPEEVGMCAVLTADISNLFLNSFCFGFRFHDGAEADGLFLAYYLRSKQGREMMKSLAQGSTRYNLSKIALLNSSLRLPCLPEQTAIVEVLADMDAEITALEQRREKSRDLRQALMQELLTGKTRLV